MGVKEEKFQAEEGSGGWREVRSWNGDGVVALCCVYGQDNSFSHKSKGKNPVRCLQYEPYLG